MLPHGAQTHPMSTVPSLDAQVDLEGVPVEVIGSQVGGPHLDLGLGVTMLLAHTEPGHVGSGALGHRRHPGIGCVEHGPTVRPQCLEDLALGPGDGVPTAELTQMGGAHVEHHGDVRGNDVGEPTDVATTTCPHLGDEECGVPLHGTGREGHPDLVVERADR